MEFILEITDELGLHARPASAVSQVAAKFESEITISANGKDGNLKSVMSIMAMAVKQGDKVTIKLQGVDAEEAATAVKEAFTSNGLA